MNRFVLLFIVSTVLLAGACREKAQTTGSTAAPTPAAPVVTVSPQPVASGNPSPAVAVPGQMPKSLNDIPERLRRPLTLEEIKQLPPETRDMILKAIGQPVPAGSPAPAPKK